MIFDMYGRLAKHMKVFDKNGKQIPCLLWVDTEKMIGQQLIYFGSLSEEEKKEILSCSYCFKKGYEDIEIVGEQLIDVYKIVGKDIYFERNIILN